MCPRGLHFKHLSPPFALATALKRLQSVQGRASTTHLSFGVLAIVTFFFHYTRCIMPKRVTSLRGPSSSHCARATELLSKKYHSGGEPLATLCPI